MIWKLRPDRPIERAPDGTWIAHVFWWFETPSPQPDLIDQIRLPDWPRYEGDPDAQQRYLLAVLADRAAQLRAQQAQHEAPDHLAPFWEHHHAFQEDGTVVRYVQATVPIGRRQAHEHEHEHEH